MRFLLFFAAIPCQIVGVCAHQGLFDLRMHIMRENGAGRPVYEGLDWHYTKPEMRDYQHTLASQYYTNTFHDFGNGYARSWGVYHTQGVEQRSTQEVPHNYWDDDLHTAFFGRTEDGLTAEALNLLRREGVSATYLSNATSTENLDGEQDATIIESVDFSSISQSLLTALQDPGLLTRTQLEQILTVLSGVSLPAHWTHDPQKALRWALRKIYAEKRLAQLARADAEEDETYFINWSAFLRDPYLGLWDVTQTMSSSEQVDDETISRVFQSSFDSFRVYAHPKVEALETRVVTTSSSRLVSYMDAIDGFRHSIEWAPAYRRARWFFQSKLTELMDCAQQEEALFDRVVKAMVNYGTTCEDATAVGLEELYGIWLERYLQGTESEQAEKARLSASLAFFKRALLKMYQGLQDRGENIEAALNLDRLVNTVISLGLSVRTQRYYQGNFGAFRLEGAGEALLETNINDIVDSLVYQTIWASYLDKDPDLRALQEESADAAPEFWETDAGEALQRRLAEIPRIKTLEALKRHGYLVNTPLYSLELLDITRDLPT